MIQSPSRLSNSRRIEPRLRKRRIIGLALGGGGARGAAHLGVLKVLTDSGIVIERIAGTSVGAMVGAFHCAGYAPDETLDIFRRELALWRNLCWIPGAQAAHTWSLFRLGGWRRKLDRYFGHLRLQSLRIPLATVATDLIRGQVVVRERGSVADAVLESLSMPGMTRPVYRDGMALVDGGVLNNLPADVVRERGSAFVVAVDVGARLASGFGSPSQPTPRLMATMARVIAVQQQSLRLKAAQAADVVLEPDVSHFKFADFGQFDAMAAAGAACVHQKLASLQESRVCA